MELKIEYIPVDELKPYEKNAKKHPAEQIDYIANSIREFGFRQPLVIDKDNVLVIGHGRLLAAKKLGLDSVPCVRADDLTDEQIKALRLADNKTNESDWDFEYLDVELDNITDIDMSDFGFLSSTDLFDYMNNDSFVDREFSAETFGITFQIDIQYKATVENYIKENGKDTLVNAILKEIENA